MRLFIALSVILLAPLVTEAQAACRAVIVGVSEYTIQGVDWLNYAHLDAQQFANQARQRGCITVVKQNKDATVAAVREAITDALRQAGVLDEVYLFFSTRGIATSYFNSHAGYIVLYDSKESEPASTALSTDDLKSLIDLSRKRVILIADLRASDRLQPINLIDFKLKDFVPVTKGPPSGKLSEILATQPHQFSTELGDPNNPRSRTGNGAFSLALLNELKAGHLSVEEIGKQLDAMRKSRPGAFRTPQSPSQFGPPIDLPKAVTRLQVWPRNPFGALLIRASFEPGRADAPADPAPQDNAVDSENKGQEVLIRYGEGNQFPNEPGRPEQKDFESAATDFQNALDIRKQLDGQDPGLLQSLEARSLFCKGRAMLFDPKADYKAALDILRSSADKRKDYPEAWNAMGIAHLEHAEYDDAKAGFEQAIQLAPDWAYPRHNLALTYVEQGDYAAAEKEYREAIRRTPYHPYLYYNLGVLLHRINRKSDARTEYELAIKEFEWQAALALDRERRFSEDGDTDDAKRFGERSATLLKNEAEVYNALGAIAQAEGHTDKARAAYQAARTHNPKLLLATYNLGILEAKKSPDKAIGLWREVLAGDKDYLPAHQRLAETLAKRGRADESKAEYREVQRLQSEAQSGAPH